MLKVNEKNVSLVSEYITRTKKDNWECNQWRCKLRYNGKQYSFDYYTGLALGEPTVEMALGSLVMDATSYLNARDFEDWASDLGYDTDSRKAEKTYQECGKIAVRLEKMFGDVWELCDYLQSKELF